MDTDRIFERKIYDRYLVYTKDYFKEGSMKYLPAYLAYYL